MDFFAHQDRARRNTSLLVLLYALAVTGIIVSVYLVVRLVFGSMEEPAPTAATGLWDAGQFLWVSISVLALVLTGSLFKTMQLSAGGSAVASSLGGRPVAPDTRDADERRLLNVVEEMALAAGIAVPQVYLLDSEPGINAFAAGFTTRDAVIGVTRGCVQQLSRDELQGVIAHEFSHIVNGDMRLNIRLMGILFGILMLTIVGRILIRTAHMGQSRSRNDKKGGNPLPFLGLALIIIGYIGVFFANLIKSAISRQREYLSDASAVQFTRNPSGIAGALKKIGGLKAGSMVSNAHASEASHLFFGSIGGFSLGAMLATHPPLAERIKRLDPAFNPEISRLMNADGGTVAAGTAGFEGASAGTANLGAAATTLRNLPATLLDEAHDPVGARVIIYALLWSDDSDVQRKQQRALEGGDPQAVSRLSTIRKPIADLPDISRLPLAELAVPAMRLMPNAEYARFRETLQALIEADSEINLFEFALSHMIIRHVAPAFEHPDKAPVHYRKLESILPACRTVLVALAAWGSGDRRMAQDAYEAGLKALGQPPAPMMDAQAVSLKAVSDALDKLAQASPALKRLVVEACAACIKADGVIAGAESDLLRAIADAMDIPMPPL
jgi:Zn-dependent protease with chaperone function